MISPASISAIFETMRFMNSRSCEVIRRAPGNDLRNCSSQMIDSMSRWLVGSSISSTSGRPSNAHLPAAGQCADIAVDLVFVEAEAVQYFARLRFESVAAQVLVLLLYF